MENPPHEFGGLLFFFFLFKIIINFILCFFPHQCFHTDLLRTEKVKIGKGDLQRSLSGLFTTTGAY